MVTDSQCTLSQAASFIQVGLLCIQSEFCDAHGHGNVGATRVHDEDQCSSEGGRHWQRTCNANGPCRGCATAVSCRAASCTSRRACPCPVLLCTLHIGGSNSKSRATCDSPVPPRSHTDVPAPSDQQTCRIHPEHIATNCTRRPSGAVISIRSQRLPCKRTHLPPEPAVPDASLLLPAECVHPACMSQEACSLQAHQPSRIGRQRPPGA